MPDESIEVQILVETSEALKNAEEIRQRLDALKKEMFDLSSQGKQALKDVAAGMIEAKKAAQELAKVEYENLYGEVDKDFIKQQKEELTQYSKDVRTALAEALKEETEYFKQQEQLAKQASTTRKAEFKSATDDEKAQAKEAAKAQSEYAKVTQQGFGVMSAAAQQYGTRIQKIKDIIVNTAQSTGQSWDQVAQRMQKFGVSTKDINQALKELNSQTKATTQSTKIFGIEVGKLGDIGKFVFGSILGITAVTAIREIIGLFKDAAGEAIGF